MAGYSSTPLGKKLGIKTGDRVKTQGAPGHYVDLLEPLPEKVNLSSRLRGPVDVWHLFVTSRKNLPDKLEKAMAGIVRDGMIWVSWPKKASGVVSDMTEGEVRKAALPLGLVDVKVCAVDDTWSGLKLVIRKHLR